MLTFSETKLVLRDYQERAVAEVIREIHNRPILVAPTGSGKTVMAVEVVERMGAPTLWLAHRRELIEQAANRLSAHGMTVGVIQAGQPRYRLAPVQVASVASLLRREKPAAGLIVIDEAHHAAAKTYGTILEAYPDTPFLGLTATPFRLDGRGLGDLFGSLVVSSHTDELCDAGYLIRPKVWASAAPDLRGVKMTAGDYNNKALAKRTNTPELTGDIVSTWLHRSPGMRTVVFAVDVQHATDIAEAFQAAGVAAESLSGKTAKGERAGMLRRLATGETKVVTNCMVLTEGWDLPALECAIIARPTASLNLHLQMVGRIMRSAEGKVGATVLDHAGNHHVHGFCTRRIEYSLDGTKKAGESEPLGLRRCRECGLFYEPTLFACPACGWTPTAAEYQEKDRPAYRPGKLSEFNDGDHTYRAQVWIMLEAERMAAGYKEGWSAYRFKERFGVMPAVVDGELIDKVKVTMDQKRTVHLHYLEVAKEKGYSRGWASHRYREIFGVWPRSGAKKESIRARYGTKL